MPGHGDGRAVGENVLRHVSEALDEAEDVVPPSAVEPCGVVAQFVQDFVGFEGGQDGFDQHGGLDGPDGNVQGLLGVDENVVPQAGLQVTFHFRKIEIRTGAAFQQSFGVVVEVEAEIEYARRHRLSVHRDVLFHQVPSPGADNQHGGLFAQPILLSFGGGELDGPLHRIDEVDLALDCALPRGAVGVLEIGHEDRCAGVQGVDDHLAVYRTGDLHAPVLQILGDRGDPPVLFADVPGLGKKIRHLSPVDFLLPLVSFFQHFQSSVVVAPMQISYEIEGVRGEYFFEPRSDFPSYFDSLRESFDVHAAPPLFSFIFDCRCRTRYVRGL